VQEKRCVRKPGVGFEYRGRRMMGITEFLRRSYYPLFNATRRSFKVAGKSSKKKHSSLGMRMGSMADHAITAYVKTGSIRKMAQCPAARRLAAFLHRNKLKLVDAHVLVCEPKYNLATEIDVLCHGVHGLVVIENKTTLQTLAEHKRTYKLPDRDNPVLLHGLRSLLNNEYNHHQLQLAAMLIILRNTYGIKATGHVLVASTDGLCHYPMNEQILNLLATSLCTMHHFQKPQSRLTSNPDIPSVSYAFRPFASHETTLLSSSTLPKIAAKFLEKNKTEEVKYNHAIGSSTFHERSDVIIPMTMDIMAESETELFLILVKHTTLDSKACIKAVSPELPKLPTGHRNTLLTSSSLELAIKAHTYLKGNLRYPKKIQMRVLFVPEKGSPFLRVVPACFLKAVK